jgi:hypothetical protein
LDEETSKRNKLKSSTSKSSLSSTDDGDRSDADTDVERKKSNAVPGKMGYIQMAKLGYQELINAIIRPPRADYKVCVDYPTSFLYHTILSSLFN